MDKTRTEMTPEQSFFSVFCTEALADELHTTGDKIYKLLADDSDILDAYIVPHYETLHTQGRDWIVDDRSILYREIVNGISDMHCRSDGYLAEELQLEQKN